MFAASEIASEIFLHGYGAHELELGTELQRARSGQCFADVAICRSEVARSFSLVVSSDPGKFEPGLPQVTP